MVQDSNYIAFFFKISKMLPVSTSRCIAILNWKKDPATKCPLNFYLHLSFYKGILSVTDHKVIAVSLAFLTVCLTFGMKLKVLTLLAVSISALVVEAYWRTMEFNE